MADIVMPRLSDTMEEGTILRWLKRDGELVARGEPLVEIETDKASMTYESDQAGALSIVAEEGTTLAVGELIAHVGERSQDAGTSQQGNGERPADPAPGEPTAALHGGGPRAQAPARSAAPAAGERRVRASPLARRIAAEQGVEVEALSGSGPGGRVVKADVLAASAGESVPSGKGASREREQPEAVAPAPALEEVARAKGETTIVELSRVQHAIARRMAESKATIPDFTLQIDVDMQECVRLREELKRLSHPAGEQQGPASGLHGGSAAVPTYNDMVVKAAALALREHPTANGSYRDGKVQLHARVNVGVAVAAQGSLVVPTVFDADVKALGEIARETRTLAERVRTGTVTPPELGGGTFTVSNLGMYGVRSFTAIINPPQAGILSVGELAERAVVYEGQLQARHTMTLVLASDHRILYGAEAALLLARIRELLQAPSSLTL